MNNKGFAITTILYGVLIIFCLLLVSMLGILATYRNNLSKIIDENSGARSIVEGDTINTNTFKPTSGTGSYLGNGVYELEKTEKWTGYCLQTSLFEDNQKYRFTYSVQKTDGTLKSIGGRAYATRDLTFILDSDVQESDPASTIQINPYHDVGPTASGYAPEVNVPDDTDVHEVILTFTYDSSAAGSNYKTICIHPNRGLETNVKVNIFNLKLVKLS